MTNLISVIVTTYNRPDALDAVLRALSHQTDRGFEIVVADDGSGPETAVVIENWTTRLPVPLKHVWQQNRGFRGAESRNRGIGASSGRYCIFLDGDCLARADFIATHTKTRRTRMVRRRQSDSVVSRLDRSRARPTAGGGNLGFRSVCA